MAYLIAILASIALFAGFLVLTSIEARRGARVFARARTKLDHDASRIEFIATHVDLGAAVWSLLVTGAETAAHDVAHAVLVIIRFVERLLTRTVRALRERRADAATSEPEHVVEAILPSPAPAATATPLVKTLHGLKEHLRRHPKSPRRVSR